MGSYISLGFVYRYDKEAKNSLKQLLALLNLKDINYKICLDVDADQWVERQIKFHDLNDFMIETLINYYYCSLKLKTNFLGFSNLPLTLTIYKSEIYYGFLVDLIEDYFQISSLELEALMIAFIEENYQKLNFDYAFGEHDGEIEYSFEEVLNQDVNYSLLFINNNSLQIKKGDYLLDGLTAR